MSIISSFFNNELTYIYKVTKNSYGDTTQVVRYKNVPCRWQDGTSISPNPDVVQTDVKAEVWLEGNLAIDESDEIVFNNDTYTIKQIMRKRNLDGTIDHIKLVLV